MITKMQIRKVQRKQAEALIKKRGIAMAKSNKKSIYFTDDELQMIFLVLSNQDFSVGQKAWCLIESALGKIYDQKKNRESK